LIFKWDGEPSFANLRAQSLTAMLTAICANFGDFWRLTTDELSLPRIQMSRGGTQRRLFAATENQGVAGSNPALDTTWSSSSAMSRAGSNGPLELRL
jgi:hypothetical protein